MKVTTKRITELTYEVAAVDEREAIIKVMDFIRTNEAEGVELEDINTVAESIEFIFAPEDSEEDVTENPAPPEDTPINTNDLDDPLDILDEEEKVETSKDEVQKLIEKESNDTKIA